jgi:hypothetical protein
MGCCAMKNIPVNKNNTKVSRYAVAKSYLVSLNDVTFVHLLAGIRLMIKCTVHKI